MISHLRILLQTALSILILASSASRREQPPALEPVFPTMDLPRNELAAPSIKATSGSMPHVGSVDPTTWDKETWVEEMAQKGVHSFPEMSQILTDPESDPLDVCRAFAVIIRVKSPDRQQFLPLALARVGDDSSDVRCSAVILLKEIGRARDAHQFVHLLMDREISVSFAAVQALGSIGGEKEAAVLGSWLTSSHRYLQDDFYHRNVIESLNALQNRLATRPKDF